MASAKACSERLAPPYGVVHLSSSVHRFCVRFLLSVSEVGRAVTSRASNLKVRGSTLSLDEIFVRCFSVSPTHMESEKTGNTLSVMLEVALVVAQNTLNSLL